MKLTKQIIKLRREQLNKKVVEVKDYKTEDVAGRKQRLATLDLLLEGTIDGKPLTDSDILEEVQIMMVAVRNHHHYMFASNILPKFNQISTICRGTILW